MSNWISEAKPHKLALVPFVPADSGIDEPSEATHGVLTSALQDLREILSMPFPQFLAIFVLDQNAKTFLDSFLSCWPSFNGAIQFSEASIASQSQERKDLELYIFSVYYRLFSNEFEQHYSWISDQMIANNWISRKIVKSFSPDVAYMELVWTRIISPASLLDLPRIYHSRSAYQALCTSMINGVIRRTSDGLNRLIEPFDACQDTLEEIEQNLVSTILTLAEINPDQSSRPKTILQTLKQKPMTDDVAFTLQQLLEYLVDITDTWSSATNTSIDIAYLFASRKEKESNTETMEAAAAANISTPTLVQEQTLKGVELIQEGALGCMCRLYDYILPLLMYVCKTSSENKKLIVSKDIIHNLQMTIETVANGILNIFGTVISSCYLLPLSADFEILSTYSVQSTLFQFDEITQSMKPVPNKPFVFHTLWYDQSMISERLYELLVYIGTSISMPESIETFSHTDPALQHLIQPKRHGSLFCDLFGSQNLELFIEELQNIRMDEQDIDDDIHGFCIDETRTEYLSNLLQNVLSEMKQRKQSLETQSNLQTIDPKIQQILDIFPTISIDYAQDCLNKANGNIQNTILKLSADLTQDMSSVSNSLGMNLSQFKKQHSTSKGLGFGVSDAKDDAEFQKKMKAMIQLRAFDEYEDEYDDSFDSAGVYGVNDDRLADKELPNPLHKIQFSGSGGKHETVSDSDTSSRRSRTGKKNQPNTQNDSTTSKSQSKQTQHEKNKNTTASRGGESGGGHGSGRGGGRGSGGGRGRGTRAKAGMTANQSHRKEQQKARVGNHNRKAAARRKAARGM